MIPKIDSELGLSVYSTCFSGVYGKIKQSNDDFTVREVLSDKVLSTISDTNGLAVYLLRKNGIDTRHALLDVEKQFGLALKSFGLKDAYAITEQYVQAKYTSKLLENIQGKNYTLKLLGFTKKPISKRDMLGNKFTIKISLTQN